MSLAPYSSWIVGETELIHFTTIRHRGRWPLRSSRSSLAATLTLLSGGFQLAVALSVNLGVDDCSFCVVSPLHREHRLWIDARGDSVEVRYDDARPPGPAEKLFVYLEQQPKEVADAVVGFVRDLFADRVVVVRKRLDRFTRLLRQDCDSSAKSR